MMITMMMLLLCYDGVIGDNYTITMLITKLRI